MGMTVKSKEAAKNLHLVDDKTGQYNIYIYIYIYIHIYKL